MKRRPFTAKRCKCGHKPMHGQGHCRRCRNEYNDRYERLHPRQFHVAKREHAIAEYRRQGLIPPGVCECGKPGIPRLVDIHDPSSVFYRCRSCRMTDDWRWRRARAGKVAPVETPRRKHQFTAEHMAKLNEGLKRWRQERVRIREQPAPSSGFDLAGITLD